MTISLRIKLNRSLSKRKLQKKKRLKRAPVKNQVTMMIAQLCLL